jgi:hypothetical protein
MMGRAAVIALVTAALGAAASDPVAAILDQARTTPPEIFADVAFRLLDDNRIAGNDRVALLDEVFLRADGARQPAPLRPAAGLRIGPADLHLDALSIKCRVVKALLDIDGQRARELFTQVARPQLAKPDCSTAILTDPTIYFDTLAQVVTKAPFTAEEQKKQVPFWMMADAVHGIGTSLEVVAAARNFSQLVHSENEALAMSSAFAAALNIDDSDRNFGAAATRGNLVDAVQIASDRFARLGASPRTMQEALRGYLVRHLAAVRCEDSSDADYAFSVSLFNQILGQQSGIQPISEDDSQPAKREGRAEKPPQRNEDGLNELANDVRALATKEPDPDQVRKVLDKLRDWKGAPDEDAVSVFQRKAGIYSTLLMRFRVVAARGEQPAASFWPSIVSGLISTLEDSSVLDASPCDWLYQVSGVERTSVAKLAVSMAAPTDIAQAMMGSSLSSLAVYGRLEMLDR